MMTDGVRVMMKRQLPWLWHGFFLAITLSMMEMNTILPGLIAQLTDNRIVFGAFYSVLLGAPLLFNLPMSRVMIRYQGRRLFLLIGIYVRTVAFLCMAAVVLFLGRDDPVPALVILLILLFLFAIGGGLAGTAYSDLVGRLFSDAERGRLYAVRQFVMGIGALIGGAMVARLLMVSSMDLWMRYTVFFAIGAVGLFLGALGFWAVQDRTRQEKTDGSNAGTDLSISPETAEDTRAPNRAPNMFTEAWITLKEDPQYARFILVENITSFSLMLLPFYLVYASQRFLDYEKYLGAYVLLQILGSLSSNFLWGWISAKVGNRSVIRLCISFGASMPLIALLLAAGGPIPYAIVFFFIGVVTSGRNIGFEPYLLEIAPAAKRTTYIGLRGTLNLLDVLLPLAGGAFIQFAGFSAAFIGVSAMMFLSLYLFRNKSSSIPEKVDV